MRRYKYIDGDYIVAIGTGNGGEEITESEYNKILEAIKNKPTLESYDYHVKTDLTYEAFEVEQVDIDEDATIEDYQTALSDLGVI